jgi:hypothetical protein
MIVVGTTLAAYVMDQEDTWASWMRNAETVQASHGEVCYFAAIEIDRRGLDPFGPFLDRLAAIGGKWWTFLFDDGRTEVTTRNRLNHITLGQNLATMYAVDTGASHLLFAAADQNLPDDVLPRMLELGHPLCAPYIDTYCITGPQATMSATGVDYIANGWDVMDCMASAACIFIAREVFKRLRWRVDPELGMSDDPSYHYDADGLLGIRTHVRRDVPAAHYLRSIGAIESRGHDMRVVR